MKNLFLTLMVCGSVFAANTLSVTSVSDDGAGTVTFSLGYMFEDEVGGFQLDLLTDGLVSVTGASGGDASAAWSVSTNSSGTILGFSFSGTTMAPGSGHFLDVTGTYDVANLGSDVMVSALEDCETNPPSSCNDDGDTRMVLSTTTGTALESSFSTACWTVGSSEMCGTTDDFGCTDPSACNYDPSANYDNGSCEYVVDCNGECGGDAQVDECGICEGDGSSCVQNGCDSETDVCLSLDGSTLSMDNSVDVGGFQFNHDGCATYASGGDLSNIAGFFVSASGTTVLAFSFSGGTIPAGSSGSLVELGSEYCTEESLSGFIFSEPDGNALIVGWSEVVSGGCTDITACNYDPSANYDDGSCEYPLDDCGCDIDESCDGCDDDAGEFGDNLVVAPDVINTLKISTQDPDEIVPGSDSDLYDAHDTFPADSDLNSDGDVYDAQERGGDGYIDVNDVIYSLKAATMVPDYPVHRRATVEYPFSTRPEGSREVVNRTNDYVHLGSTSGYPGQIVSIPVTIQRGDSGELSGFVSGFGLTYENDINLVDNIDFELIGAGNTFMTSDEDYLSLLVMDMEPITPNDEIIVGYISLTIPADISTSMNLMITSNAPSGSSPSYETIGMLPGSSGVISIDATSQGIDMILNPYMMNFSSFNLDLGDVEFTDVFNEVPILLAYNDDLDYLVPEFGINNIGSIDLSHGYYIFTTEQAPSTFSINGPPIDVNMQLELDPYMMNLIPYLPSDIRFAQDVFSNTSVILVSGDGGQFYVPGQDVNTLDLSGGMSPGEAYRVFIDGSESIDFVYGNSSNSREDLSDNDRYEQTLTQVYSHNVTPTGLSYPIIITDIIGQVEAGDEIVAYSNDKIVGATRIVDKEFPIVIAAWEGFNHYGLSLDGYTPGDPIDLRYYSISLDKELKLTMDLSQLNYGQGVFSSGTVDLTDVLPESFSMEPAYPNPFNPSTTIRFGVPMDTDINLSIYDINGRLIETIENGFINAGYHSRVWNATNYSSGLYIVRMNSKSGFNSTQKIVLIK